MNFEALKIIVQRPNKDLNYKTACCPFCKSKKFIDNGSTTTLVGGNNNHVWNKRRCECGKDYVVEKKGDNFWVTSEGKVYDGIPTCFEYYIYDCKCGGIITRDYTDLEGNPVSSLRSSITESGVIKHYKTFYQCDKCKEKIATTTDYYKD